jgi:hypothetical protein
VKRPLEHRGLKRTRMSEPPLAPALKTTGESFASSGATAATNEPQCHITSHQSDQVRPESTDVHTRKNVQGAMSLTAAVFLALSGFLSSIPRESWSACELLAAGRLDGLCH